MSVDYFPDSKSHQSITPSEIFHIWTACKMPSGTPIDSTILLLILPSVLSFSIFACVKSIVDFTKQFIKIKFSGLLLKHSLLEDLPPVIGL